MITDFDQLLLNRKSRIVKLITDNINYLRHSRIPQGTRIPFLNLADQLAKFLVALGAEPPNTFLRYPRKKIRVDRSDWEILKENDSLDLLDTPKFWDPYWTAEECQNETAELVEELRDVLGDFDLPADASEELPGYDQNLDIPF